MVTGASSGIGRAVARAFAARGARTVVTARSADVLNEVVRECAAAHPRAEAVAVSADVNDAQAVAGAAETALDRGDLPWHSGTDSSKPRPTPSGRY